MKQTHESDTLADMAQAHDARDGEDTLDGTGVITETKRETTLERPRLYKVLLHNDDYTTREFVVDLLRLVFHKDDAQAVQIMLHVHRQGIGVAGLYPREVAETKVVMATHMAREHNFPLRLTLEAQED